MSRGSALERLAIYGQAKELVDSPHFNCPAGLTPPIFRSFFCGTIILVDRSIPYNEYVEILRKAEKPAIPSYSTVMRIFRNDKVKDTEGQFLDAAQIKRLSSFLSELKRSLVDYDEYMLENAKICNFI